MFKTTSLLKKSAHFRIMQRSMRQLSCMHKHVALDGTSMKPSLLSACQKCRSSGELVIHELSLYLRGTYKKQGLHRRKEK